MDDSMVPDNFGLEETRSSYVSQSQVFDRKGRSIYGRMLLIFELFLVSLVIIIILVALPVFGGPVIVGNVLNWISCDFVLFGAGFIVGGWLEFSLGETIKDIPTIKIDAAAAGVNEINAAFIPENGWGLVSPMSKQRCIFYSITHERYVQDFKPRYFQRDMIMALVGGVQGRSSQHWKKMNYNSKGVPTLLTDGTGYLVVDLNNADINFSKTYYYPTGDIGTFRKGGSFDSANVGDTRVVETIIPTDTQYFVIGRISNVLGNLNNKPVKVMTYDEATKLLTVRNQSKGNIERSNLILAVASFVVGIAFAILGLSSLGLI